MNSTPRRSCESTITLSFHYLDFVDSRGRGGVSTPPYPLSARELFPGWVFVSISSTPSSHSLSSPPNPSSLLSQPPSFSLSCCMISSAAAATSARLNLHEASVRMREERSKGRGLAFVGLQGPNCTKYSACERVSREFLTGFEFMKKIHKQYACAHWKDFTDNLLNTFVNHCS